MEKLNLSFIQRTVANKKYFYANCDISRALMELMGRKAFIKGDAEKINKFLNTIGLEINSQVEYPPTDDF